MGDGLAHVDVVEGLDVLVEGEAHVGAIRLGQDTHAVNTLELRHLVDGQLGGDVDRSVLLREEARVLVREEVELDGLSGRVAAPPGATLFEDGLGVGLEGHGLVRACSHDEVGRGAVGGGRLVEGLFGDPQSAVRGDRPPEVDGGCGQGDRDLVVAALLGLDARGPVDRGGRGLVGVLGDVDGEEDVLDGDRVPVLEQGVRSDIENPGLGVVSVIGGRNRGDQLTVLAHGQEAFGDDLRDVVVDDAGFVGGVQRGQGAGQAHRDGPLAGGRLGCAAAGWSTGREGRTHHGSDGGEGGCCSWDACDVHRCLLVLGVGGSADIYGMHRRNGGRRILVRRSFVTPVDYVSHICQVRGHDLVEDLRSRAHVRQGDVFVVRVEL